MNQPKPTLDLANATAPGIGRRLAAWLYDILLVFGLWLFVTTLFTVPSDLMFGAETAASLPQQTWFRLILLLVPPLFFIGFWSKGGQTLGMRAWKLMVVTQSGQKLDLKAAFSRFVAATLCLLPMGLGLFWMLFDKDGLALHDRLSKTRLIILSKKT